MVHAADQADPRIIFILFQKFAAVFKKAHRRKNIVFQDDAAVHVGPDHIIGIGIGRIHPVVMVRIAPVHLALPVDFRIKHVPRLVDAVPFIIISAAVRNEKKLARAGLTDHFKLLPLQIRADPDICFNRYIH